MGRAFKIVILGGGVAAGYAALEFVNKGIKRGDLCIISEEAVAPYERPALSKGCLLPEGAVTLPSFHTCVGVGAERLTPEWYKDHGIELMLSTPIKAVDVTKKTLMTASRETFTYGTLIIATGARVIKLEEIGVTGADARNVCYLRDLNDANELIKVMASCRGRRAVVIGGGYIGMECAAALVTNKILVTMVFPNPHCMTRLFTPEIAAFYEDYYRERGVQFVKGAAVTSFERGSDKKVTAAILKDGTRVECDMVVVGVGIRPNVQLFEGQLTLEKGGITVNGSMQTSNSCVYAIGDVATFPSKLYGDLRRVEHVDHARKSACHVAHTIMAPERVQEYDYLPYFYSRVFTLSWQFYGDNVGECMLFGSPADKKFGAFWVDKGLLVGVFLEGGNKDEYEVSEMVARLRPPIRNKKLLAKQGLSYPFSLNGPSTSQSSRMSSISDILLHLSALQITAGLAIVASLVVLWCGRLCL